MGEPGTAFIYAPGRSGQYADDILKGFSGILQMDGYAGYNRLLKRVDDTVALAQRARVSAKAPLGEALRYIAKYWDGLCLFLADGRIEMDNNAPAH